MFPKDKEALTKQSNIIYWFKCVKTECDDGYIGESVRTFGKHYKEHLKAPSPKYDQQNTTGHITTVDNFKIISREGQNMGLGNKRSNMHQSPYPTLNRNIGKYNLPHIWDKVLLSTQN